MTTINGVTYTPPTSTMTDKGPVSTPAPGMDLLTGKNTRNTSSTGFDKDTFLKLLVAQLKYQDPSKPSDSGQLMQQTSQLSMVESTNDMTKQVAAMVSTYSSMLAEQRMSSAVSLVGKKVTYAPDATKPETVLTGLVDSVKFDATGPILKVGGKDVPLNNVTTVLAA